MSIFFFSEDLLESQLADMTQDEQLAFALLCCERLMPNYLAFVAESGWGNAAASRHAIDIGWAFLTDGSVDKDIDKVRQQCDQSAPDTEEWQTTMTSAALDTAVATATLLDYVKDSKVERIVAIASLARDTVDMYVQEKEKMAPGALDLEERIRLHPLMQCELKLQHEDLDKVQAISNFRSLKETFRGKRGSILLL